MCPDDMHDELLHSSPTRIQTVETQSHIVDDRIFTNVRIVVEIDK